MLTLLLVVNSCSWFSRKEITLTHSDFATKYYELPDDQGVIEYVVAGPIKLYEYVKVNEATNACEKKKTPELKQKCRKLFSEL